MSTRWLQDALLMAFRVVAIVFGGYGLTSALCVLAGMLLHAMGMPLAEAMLTTLLLGYVFYIGLVMWGFADRTRFFRPWAILFSTAVAMSLAALLAPVALPS